MKKDTYSFDQGNTALNNETFTDLQVSLYNSLVGNLNFDPSDDVYKGHHLSVTVRDKYVLYADSEEQRAKFGQLALTSEEYIDTQENKDLEPILQSMDEAIKSLGDTVQMEIFQNGRMFANVEIFLPTENKIPDNKDIVIFHGAVEVDVNGKFVNKKLEITDQIADHLMILDSEKEDSRVIIFSDSDTVSYIMLYKELVEHLDRIRQEFNLPKSATFYQYKEMWWKRELSSLKNNFVNKDFDEVLTALINNVPLSSNVSPQTEKWFSEFKEVSLPRMKKILASSVNKLFIKNDLASMRRVIDTLISNDPGALTELRKEMQTSLDAVNASEDKFETLRNELDRLKKEGVDKVVPDKGLIFIDAGRPRHLKGTVSPLSQIGSPIVGASSSASGDNAQSGNKNSGDNSDELKKILQMKIQNPKTGNMIKIDTAMDYNKKHPAHVIALNTIRKYMGDISTRAGVGKQSKSDK